MIDGSRVCADICYYFKFFGELKKSDGRMMALLSLLRVVQLSSPKLMFREYKWQTLRHYVGYLAPSWRLYRIATMLYFQIMCRYFVGIQSF
jgi:hypothetical protein